VIARLTRTLASLLVAAAALTFGSSCGEDPTSTATTLNLDQPIDVAFACYGGLRITDGATEATPDMEVVSSAQPMASCETRSQEIAAVPPGQEFLNMGNDPPQVAGYAFILQSVPGTVAIATFPNQPPADFQGSDTSVLDADVLTPGKNGIAVGSFPVAIATDASGCHMVTANAGSCDLSVLEVNSVLQRTPAPAISRVAVTNGAGEPVLSKPAAMVVQPPETDVGFVCPETAEGVFYIAYPSCHVVAAVDGSTGAILQAIELAADGTATVVDADAVSCPAECGDDRDPPTAGARPVTLDLVDDQRVARRRLAIGAEDVALATVVDIDPVTQLFTTIQQVPLEGEIGLIDISLSPQIGMGGSGGQLNDDEAPGGQSQFIYAVATDSTVRVADVLDDSRECETQVDPRFVHDANVIGDLSCLPIGDPLYPRRADAISPGLAFTSDPVPLSVRIFAVDRPDGDPGDPSPATLVGYFAAIGLSSGDIVFANVDDDNYFDTETDASPVAVNISLALPHQIRDSIAGRDARSQTTEDDGTVLRLCDNFGADPTEDGDFGGPRITDAPTRFLNTAFIGETKGYTLPNLRQIYCDGDDDNTAVSELQFAAPDEVRESAFPDWRAIRKLEQWDLVWEGSLSRDEDTSDVDGPPVRVGEFKVGGTGMRLEDASAPFCRAGVEPHDVVAMSGCDPSLGDAQCPTDYTCYVHPDSEVSTGSCLRTDQIDFLTGPCRDFLIGVRRYSVTSVHSGEIRVTERPRVLRTTPITGCTSAQQCEELAVVDARLATDIDPGVDTTPAEQRDWVCEPDPTRTPENLPRCMVACDPEGDSSTCPDGSVCGANGRCVEGVIPPLQCVEALQRYELRASDAYAVIGTSAGYQHSIIEDPTTHECIPDPDGNPLLVGRIPLTAPPCTPDSLTNLTPNPCQTTIAHTYLEPRYVPGTCDAANPDEELVTRDVTAIRFKNPQMTFHLVQPTYPGDLACKGDRLGGLVDVPVLFPGQTIEFIIADGIVAKGLGLTTAVLPVRVVRGPQNSLWVVDEGGYQTSSANYLGHVYRFEPSTLVVNTMQ
jgi:hypothetical protein